MKKEKIKKERKKISKYAMGQFLSCATDYKTQSILTALLVAIEVVFDVLIPLVMTQILNIIGLPENATEFTFYLELADTKTPIFTVYDRVDFVLICGGIMLGINCQKWEQKGIGQSKQFFRVVTIPQRHNMLFLSTMLQCQRQLVQVMNSKRY